MRKKRGKKLLKDEMRRGTKRSKKEGKKEKKSQRERIKNRRKIRGVQKPKREKNINQES